MPAEVSIMHRVLDNTDNKMIEKNGEKKHDIKLQQNKMESAMQRANEFTMIAKRSVERAYTKILDRKPGTNSPPDYFKHFVKTPRKQSPLINRGHYIRMEAVKRSIESIIDQENSQRTVVLNLGSGFDPLPFQLLDNTKYSEGNLIFVDVDYPDIIKQKIIHIRKSLELSKIIEINNDSIFDDNKEGVQLRTETYIAMGCNLCEVSLFEKRFAELNFVDENTMFIFVSEVSLVYLPTDNSNNIINQASKFKKSHLVLLEQTLPAGPDHPFARTMLHYFKDLQTSLNSCIKYPNRNAQEERLKALGFQNVESNDLLYWWYTLCHDLRVKIQALETVDVPEEFFLYCQHHILLHAYNSQTNIYKENDSSKKSDSVLQPSANTSLKLYGDGNSDPKLSRAFAAGSSLDQLSHILMGGSSRNKASKSILLSDKKRDFFVEGSKHFEGKYYHTSVSVDKDIYLFGGRQQSGKSVSECYKLSLASAEPSNRYYKLYRIANMPSPRSRHCSVQLNSTEILIFGGSDISAPTFLLYNIPTDSWRTLELSRGSTILSSTVEGASMLFSGSSGLILGGIDSETENINSTLYTFTLNKSREYIEVQKLFDHPVIGRYGSKVSYINEHELLLVGGVSKERVFDKTNQIVKISLLKMDVMSIPFTDQAWSISPLLVGFELFNTGDNQFIVVGGGAGCFTYGSVYNKEILNISFENHTEPIKFMSIMEKESSPSDLSQNQNIHENKVKYSNGEPTPITQIFEVKATDLDNNVWRKILNENKPVIIKGSELGPCLEKWQDKQYLIKNVGEENYVTVHEATSPEMNFQKKNFTYKKVLFKDFIETVYGSNETKMYLRAVSFDSPKDKAADFFTDFPGIANDFALPDTLKYITEIQHSSPLRISSPETSVWLHYDVTSNILCQIIGKKKLRLYPPSQVDKLQFPSGASSSIIDNVFSDEEINTDPNLTPYECLMEPGDILFLPRLWLHATCPLDPSISLNVFWKDLDADIYAAGKDIYGNRDIGAYENSRKAISKIKAVFKNANVPEDATNFYLKRLAQELLEYK